jgi:dihydrodipicolinate synthase/N-acetylneuraminate lyase
MNTKLTGEQVIVPMVSPFNADFSIDKTAVARMCSMFVNAGVSVFALGTTGEGDSMSHEQRNELVQFVVKEVGRRSKVYAGLTGNSLSESVKAAHEYADLGADYLVAKLPAYYPMDETQMLLYLEKLADSVSLPLFIYNIPSTTHFSIPLQVIDHLSHHPNIVGLKDSEQNLERLDESIQLWGERNDFDFLIGWATMSAYGLMKGANGIVPSTGNLCPEKYVQLIDCIRNGDGEMALLIQERTNQISAFYQKGRILSYAIPALKAMMEMKGLCSGEVLPPMVSMSHEEKEKFSFEVKDEHERLKF